MPKDTPHTRPCDASAPALDEPTTRPAPAHGRAAALSAPGRAQPSRPTPDVPAAAPPRRPHSRGAAPQGPSAKGVPLEGVPGEPAAEQPLPAWRERLITTVHDLKTPVTISLLNLELAEMEHELGEVFKYTAAVRRELEFMLDTVSNLLDLERSTSGRLEMQLAPLNLGPLIVSAVARMSVLLRDKPQLRIENHITGPLPPLLGDAHKLTRVFSNLISNSINHTERGSIRIGADMDVHTRRLTISVADTGQGVRDDILRSVFKLFHGDSAGSRSTGIGLTYVRRVVEGHGGSVWLETTRGVGTTVHLKFPFAPAER